MHVFPLSAVPCGASDFRGDPLRPLAFLLAPIVNQPTNNRRSETTETWVTSEGARWGNERNGSAKTAKNRRIRWYNSLLLVFHQVSPGSAGRRSGLLCPLALSLAPISRPPTNTRRFETAEALGNGGGKGEREGWD